MYVLNPEKVNIKKYYCGGITGRYLIEKGIPLFSKAGSIWVFADTELLREVLDNAPFFVKFISNTNW